MKHATVVGVVCVVAAGTLLVATPVAAQEDADDDDVAPATQDESSDLLTEAEIIDEPYVAPEVIVDPEREEPLWGAGLGVSAGGGYAGFIDGDFNDFVEPGGGWGGRVIVGTKTRLALEASYLGTANNLDALGLSDDAHLLGNGAAAALRLSLLPSYYDFRPYLSAGVGWMHYSVDDADESTSPLRDSEDVFSVPLAGGIFYSHDWLFTDLRVQFSPAFDTDLVRDRANDDTNMSTWLVEAHIGFAL